MESIKKIFKIGYGPSSSHTMGPRKAAEDFLKRNQFAEEYRVELYASLAATGKGHLTDQAILDVFKGRKLRIDWLADKALPYHPNGMMFYAYDKDGKQIDQWEIYSVGGGDICERDSKLSAEPIYQLHSMEEILDWCNEHGRQIWEYAVEVEGEELFDYLAEVWTVMKDSIERGVEAEGCLPGGLNLPRKASTYYYKSTSYKDSLKRRSLLYAYALAVSEENAGGGKIVTAPTCGSCGVLSSVLYFHYKQHKFSDIKIFRALATAGIVGNLVKYNASVSGAEVGCQGEIGTACAMASAASIQLFGASPRQIEYAAELGLEHHLGLTCDPVAGLVQIPCIERNALAAGRALDANVYAMVSDGVHRVSFDKVVETMNQTGHDIPSIYRETSEGGLAKYINDQDKFHCK